jgi:gamma-glutamylcyclotransferase (GGCT)/AIG2-like uncharacterized protein YtfP
VKPGETYLFVYGTLRKGFSLSIPGQISSYIQWAGMCKVKGILYDIGKYPGAVPDPSGASIITGELIRITNPDRVFEFLDNYEGFDNNDMDASEYCRKLEWVELATGVSIEAWIYWYNFPVTNKQRISGNDYIKYLEKNQLA